mgnify:CR=1 FL=1
MNDFLLVVLGLVIGAIVGFFYNKKKTESTLNSATEKAKKLVEEAKARQQSLLLQAQEQSIKIINDAKNEINEEKRMLKVEKEKANNKECFLIRDAKTANGIVQKLKKAKYHIANIEKPSPFESPK